MLSDAIRFDGSDAYVLAKCLHWRGKESSRHGELHSGGVDPLLRNAPPLAAVHVRGQREAATVISDVSLPVHLATRPRPRSRRGRNARTGHCSQQSMNLVHVSVAFALVVVTTALSNRPHKQTCVAIRTMRLGMCVLSLSCSASV